MSIDGPTPNSTVVQPFLTGGWAVDRGAESGSGVDAVHVWAFPVVNGVVDAARGMFVAEGQGGGQRSDVGAVFGAQFAASGFTFAVQGLPAGVYELGVYARSTVTGSFNQVKFVRITINGSTPLMSLDGPQPNAIIAQPFLTGGWAVDLASPSGSGVDAVHVWAFPIVNGVVNPAQARFVAQGTSGGARPDVGAVFGSRFTNSGYSFVMTGLPPGQYVLGVYARSTVSGTFNQSKFVTITIQ